MAKAEVLTTYSLVRRDLSASLFPGMLTTASALVYADHNGWWQWFITLAKSGLYFSLYIYVFCLSNQIAGLKEDRINKPDRPLPSGQWRPIDATLRLLASLPLFVVVAVILGGWKLAGWAFSWEVIFILYNHLGLHKHWFTKNVIFITCGTFVLLGAGWQFVASPDALAWRLIVYVSIAFGFTLHLQDLRDVAGDSAMGRKTLPLEVGDSTARWLLAAAIASMPVFTHWALIGHLPWSVTRIAVEAVLSVINLAVAWRVLVLRSVNADHATYMLHTYWFCAILAFAGILMRAPSA